MMLLLRVLDQPSPGVARDRVVEGLSEKKIESHRRVYAYIMIMTMRLQARRQDR
jgi:hypothetical protein